MTSDPKHSVAQLVAVNLNNMSSYDEIARELGIDMDDPEEQLARDLAIADDELLEELVRLRHECGMSQQDVATALGRHRSAISNFERLGSDPHLSTIRRYAAAIGARITHHVELARGLERTCAGKTFDDHVREELTGLASVADWVPFDSRVNVVKERPPVRISDETSVEVQL